MSFRYRLAPKHTFPTQFHDCYAVVTTVLNTADKYGIDSNRVVVAGDSAGGNLATAIALKLRTSKRLLRRLLYTRLAGSLEKGSMLTIKNCDVFFFSNDEGSFALAWDNFHSKMYQLSLWYSVSSSSSQPFRRRNFRCSF